MLTLVRQRFYFYVDKHILMKSYGTYTCIQIIKCVIL